METLRLDSNQETGPDNRQYYRPANTSETATVSNSTSPTLFLVPRPLEKQLPATDALFELSITVENSHIAGLRQVATDTCGVKMDSFQIQSSRKPTQRLIRLRCFGEATIAQLMSAVMAQLECAELGRVRRV